MRIRIYQINCDRDEKKVVFSPLKKAGDTVIERGIYDLVYEADVEASDLEDVFRIFNTEHPKDYRGRSLSVSDIVEIVDAENTEKGFYYCDSFGFTKVQFGEDNGEPSDKLMKVLVVCPGKEPKISMVGTELKQLQEVVGGYIEVVYPFEDPVALIVNDEGKLIGLPLNRALYDDDGKMYDIVCGTFIICGLSEFNLASLSDELIGKYAEIFKNPECFFRDGDRIVVIPCYETGKGEEEDA